MDTLQFLRNWAPGMPHVQVSVAPIIEGGGESAMHMVREYSRIAADMNSNDPDKNREAMIKAAGIAVVSDLFGVGGGVALNYAHAFRDAARGYEMQNVYQGQLLGGEKPVARIPTETNLPSALGKAYTGFEGGREMQQAYNAQKAHDLMKWASKKLPPDVVKEVLATENDLKNDLGITEIETAKNQILQEMRDAGIQKNSPQWKAFNERMTKELAKDDKMGKFYEMKAKIWQHAADMVQEQQPSAAPTPTPMPSPQA
jgi:hypothetical protein